MHKKALVKALKEKWIFGAGLDVYEHEPSIGKGLQIMLSFSHILLLQRLNLELGWQSWLQRI